MIKWRDLGIELNLKKEELDLIETNVQENPVVTIATNMLGDWKQSKGGALVKELVTAIEKVNHFTYAATLKKG